MADHMASTHTVTQSTSFFPKQDMAVQSIGSVAKRHQAHTLTKVRRVSQKSELKLADKLAS